MDEQRTWLSKGTFLLPRPTHLKKFGSIAATVHEIVNGNENDDRHTHTHTDIHTDKVET